MRQALVTRHYPDEPFPGQGKRVVNARYSGRFAETASDDRQKSENSAYDATSGWQRLCRSDVCGRVAPRSSRSIVSSPVDASRVDAFLAIVAPSTRRRSRSFDSSVRLTAFRVTARGDQLRPPMRGALFRRAGLRDAVAVPSIGDASRMPHT